METTMHLNGEDLLMKVKYLTTQDKGGKLEDIFTIKLKEYPGSQGSIILFTNREALELMRDALDTFLQGEAVYYG